MGLGLFAVYNQNFAGECMETNAASLTSRKTKSMIEWPQFNQFPAYGLSLLKQKAYG